MTIIELKTLLKEMIEEFSDLYPEFKNNSYTIRFNNNKTSFLGRIHKISDNYFSGGHYEIEINKVYTNMVEIDDIKNTLLHELIHSLPLCMNHGKHWKIQAAKASVRGYDIQRVSTRNAYTDMYNKQRREKKQNAKYTVYCEHCGRTWNYVKMCKIIRSVMNGSTNYFCPTCQNHNLKLKINH